MSTDLEEIPLYCEEIVLRIWACISVLTAKLDFHCHVDFLSSHALKLLGLFRIITFSFSTSDCLLMLYFVLVDLNSNMFLLRGTLLRLLIPINMRAYAENLQSFATVDFCKIWNITMKDQISWHCSSVIVTLILCS
jgi:hypothetical protein